MRKIHVNVMKKGSDCFNVHGGGGACLVRIKKKLETIKKMEMDKWKKNHKPYYSN